MGEIPPLFVYSWQGTRPASGKRSIKKYWFKPKEQITNKITIVKTDIMRRFIISALVLSAVTANAQVKDGMVGINTDEPRATTKRTI